jgi:hypothetical protein
MLIINAQVKEEEEEKKRKYHVCVYFLFVQVKCNTLN